MHSCLRVFKLMAFCFLFSRSLGKVMFLVMSTTSRFLSMDVT